jgi:hypothetical protein
MEERTKGENGVRADVAQRSGSEGGKGSGGRLLMCVNHLCDIPFNGRSTGCIYPNERCVRKAREGKKEGCKGVIEKEVKAWL